MMVSLTSDLVVGTDLLVLSLAFSTVRGGNWGGGVSILLTCVASTWAAEACSDWCGLCLSGQSAGFNAGLAERQDR